MKYNQEIMLSVICCTYNHERYLRLALDGILMQQTNFTYEILIGEDYSTDNSKGILKEYETKYPNSFIVFYRDKNYGQYKNTYDLYTRARGKYIILLETDDFWISPNKLQKEVDFLENHPQFIAVSHRCIMVNDQNEPLGLQYPECHLKEYTFKEFRKDLLPGQTATIMYRNIHKEKNNKKFLLLNDMSYFVGPGDRRKIFTLLANGRIACLPDVMSAYRYVTKGGSSYSANSKETPKERILHKKIFVEYVMKCCLSDECIYTAEYMYVRELFMSILKRNGGVEKKEMISAIKNSHFKKRIIINVIRYAIFAAGRKIIKENKTFYKSNIKLESSILKEYFLLLNSKLSLGERETN